MKRSDKLFNLIQSLTQTEKRYFKLFASMAMGKESQYTLLFEALKEQTVYDENKIRERFKNNRLVNNLNMVKSRTYDLILKSMRNYHLEQKMSHSIKANIDDITFLIEKNLLNQAKELFDKTIKLALKYEHYLLVMELLRLKISLIEREKISHKNLFFEIEQLRTEMESTLNIIHIENKYLTGQLFLYIKDQFKSYKKTNRNRSINIKIGQLLDGREAKKSFLSNCFQLSMKAILLRLSNNNKMAFQVFKEIENLFDVHSHMKKELSEIYIESLIGQNICCLSWNNFLLAEKALIKAYDIQKECKLGIDSWARINFWMLNLYLYSNRFKKGMTFLLSIEEKLKSDNINKIRPLHLSNLFLYAVLYYFIDRNYKKMKFYLNSINMKNLQDPTIDIPVFIIELLSSYDKKDFDYLNYLILNIKNRIGSKYKKIIYLSALLNEINMLSDQKATKEKFMDVKNIVNEKIIEMKMSTSFMANLILNWFESKIQNKSMESFYN